MSLSEKMSWSVRDYLTSLSEMGKRCTGMQTEVESRLRQLFPPNAPESIARPCLIVDSEDVVFAQFVDTRQTGRTNI